MIFCICQPNCCCFCRDKQQGGAIDYPQKLRIDVLATALKAGAEFIQTQCIYNLDKFELWMKMARDRGLHEKVYILAGLTPMKSAGMARYMKKRVPGMDVPDEVVERLSAVPKEKQAQEGIDLNFQNVPLANVVTAMEFERFLSASGPTHGQSPASW